MRPSRALRLVPLAVLLACAAGHIASADVWSEVKVAPRWDTMWLSPRLKANWVNLRFTGVATGQPATVSEVVFDLPAGLRPLWAYAVTTRQAPAEAGRTRIILEQVPLDGTKGLFLVLASDLKAGTLEKGTCWAEAGGNKTAVANFDIKVIDVPVARQPRQIMTGAAIWPYMIDNWPDFFAQYASLGFNQMNLWHSSIHVAARYTEKPLPPQLQEARKYATAASAKGIMTSTDASISWDEELLKQDPDAQALFADGRRAGPCPSYRGPAFLEQIKRNAAIAMSGITYIQSDEETYGGGAFGTACVCPRCEARWREWLVVKRPGLSYLAPRDVIAQRNEDPDHWRAWLWFRAALTTERYVIYKAELERMVAKAPSKSSPRALMGWWAAGADDYCLEVCMQDARGLSGIVDQIIPQLYFRYAIPPRRFRELIRRQAWAQDHKNCYAGLDSDDTLSGVPGNLAAAVLETVFARAQGYCLWYGPYTGVQQWAELATVNDFIARHETTFLTGTDTDLFRSFAPEGKGDYFHPWSNDVCTATLETPTEGLLLVSDYREKREPLIVERSRQYTGPMTLRDALTNAEVARLVANQWEFRLQPGDWPVRVLTWTKAPAKPAPKARRP